MGLALSQVLIEEFMVTAILHIAFNSMFPKQKYKTIRRRIKKHNKIDRVSLAFIFKYGKNKITISTFVFCWLYRIYTVLYAIDMVVVKQPTIYGKYTMFIWEIMTIVPGVIYLRRFKG